MDVTKSNFKALLPQIKEAIEESNFLAIDTELTGLTSSATAHAFDTVEERYKKIRQGCGKFLIIQFGVSAFQYHPKQKRYTHKDFNFYIVPRPYSRQAPDPCFLCQASSLNYLVEHGFNFNKMLYEGISYLSPVEEQKLKSQLIKRHENQLKSLDDEEKNCKKKTHLKPITIPEEHMDFIQNVLTQVDSFMSSDSETVIKLEKCNPYLRKLIYQTVYFKYPTDLDLSSDQDGCITATKVTIKEKHDLVQERQTAEMDDLDNAVGFRKVIEIISEAKKLVVGHHMLLDIMHTINQFFHPLPETLESFKEILKCSFPLIADTKMIASSHAFKDCFNKTVLNELLSQLEDQSGGIPEILPADGYKGYDLSEGKLHEAGFDAFITGVCFVGLMKRIAHKNSLKEEYISPSSKLLKPFLNKLYMLRSYDIQYINLHGQNPEPNRDHVFYVTFPREWKTQDLVDLFSPFGNIYVSWLNDFSALIALKFPHNKSKVVKALVQNENVFYKVKTYADFLKMQKIGEKSITSESTDKKENSSPCIDSVVPNKRRRSSGNQEIQKCSFDPIPEEEEDRNSNKSESDSDDKVTSSQESLQTPSKSGWDISDEPEVKKLKVSKDNSPQKIFPENDSW